MLNATNSDLSTFVLGVDALVGGIVNNTIPSIVGQVKVAVAQAVTQITAAADCTYLGDDFRAVENSMCFYTMCVKMFLLISNFFVYFFAVTAWTACGGPWASLPCSCS